MISYLLGIISSAILFVISKIGYSGIFFLMFFQSFNIPIPSEITMPFSGYLASTGVFNFWLVVFLGTLGSFTGAFFSYKFASFLVQDKIRNKYWILKVLMSEKNLSLSQKWFDKYGSLSIFFGRITPIISSFISFPAGLAKMNVFLFSILTLLGSFLWCWGLALAGLALGKNWNIIQPYFREFDYFIAALIVVFAGFWLARHFRIKSKNNELSTLDK